MTDFPLTTVEQPFRAAAIAFVPALANADETTWDALEGVVTQALTARPAAMTRQLRVFIRLIDLSSRIRHGRPLARLALDRRVALLETLQRSPLLLVRRGVWGLRTLIFMGYYTQPSVVASIGYRAQPAGWSARR